jgi:uncharacterized membrane protein
LSGVTEVEERMSEANLLSGIHWVTRGLELVGIAVIVFGAIMAVTRFIRQSRSAVHGFADLRSDLGRAILLGLEFLVAADIINTVAIEPTLQSLMVLAGIVLIRTFLSFSLEVEIEGRWPWDRSRDRQSRA